ncbi:MAG: LysM peptidoglycan-binding domain-containing protein [Candidatus Omnitrophota bacterium]
MKTQGGFYLLGLSFILVLSGCVVRTYPVTKDRVDQGLTGNRGYLLGDVPAGEKKETKATRTTRVVEVELHSPIRFEKMPKSKPAGYTEDRELWGNRGFITESAPQEIAEPVFMPETSKASKGKSEKYTVQKGDTLQKISQKFYGTTKRWNKVFEANSDKLKAPGKIYPGQVIDIPVESMKEPAANLK